MAEEEVSKGALGRDVGKLRLVLGVDLDAQAHCTTGDHEIIGTKGDERSQGKNSLFP